LSPIKVYRFGNKIYCKKLNPVIKKILMRLYHVLDVIIIGFCFNSYIPVQCTIGKRLKLPHPYGVIIHNEAIIGDNVVILHQVTIGGAWGPYESIKPIVGSRAPIIGNNVVIGAGAKIVGAVTIGEHSYIGSNSVVTKDIPPYSVVVGIPAKVIKDISDLKHKVVSQ